MASFVADFAKKIGITTGFSSLGSSSFPYQLGEKTLSEVSNNCIWTIKEGYHTSSTSGVVSTL